MDFATARRSALSQLRARLNSEPELVAAFWTELASADRIAIPNLTVLYCQLSFHRKNYTILEFVSGETLEELVKRSDPADCETAIPLFCRVLDAFEDADRKPAQRPNGLKTFSDNGVSLSGFGLCRVECETTGFCHGTILVTPEGISREEIIREENGTRQDTLPLVLATYQSLSGLWPENADFAPGTLADIFIAPLSKAAAKPDVVVIEENDAVRAPESGQPAAGKRSLPPWLIAVATSVAVLAGLTGAAGLVSKFGGSSSSMSLPQFPPLPLETGMETASQIPAENAMKPGEPIVVSSAPAPEQQRAANTVPAASVRPDAPSNMEPPRVGGLTRGARLLSSPTLSYPPKARNEGVSGVVRVEVTIDEGGAVRQQRVLSGHPLLRAGITDAVKQWVYQPALLNGKPVPMTTEIEIKFNLDQKK
jgi:TonB family protein